jgi:hypothetical protein
MILWAWPMINGKQSTPDVSTLGHFLPLNSTHENNLPQPPDARLQ